ncbi:MAG: hypothetical protein HZB67_04480 [Candidatus Aenigmarchaeota archaeon]|nr:hypothetical protein [Candidatus Aenigmarchaeota archaeon]
MMKTSKILIVMVIISLFSIVVASQNVTLKMVVQVLNIPPRIENVTILPDDDKATDGVQIYTTTKKEWVIATIKDLNGVKDITSAKAFITHGSKLKNSFKNTTWMFKIDLVNKTLDIITNEYNGSFSLKSPPDPLGNYYADVTAADKSGAAANWLNYSKPSIAFEYLKLYANGTGWLNKTPAGFANGSATIHMNDSITKGAKMILLVKDPAKGNFSRYWIIQSVSIKYGITTIKAYNPGWGWFNLTEWRKYVAGTGPNEFFSGYLA